MDSITMIDIILLLSAIALLVLASTEMKFIVSKELMRLSERNKGVGIRHGMVRRKDGQGLVGDRRFNAPAQISE